MNKSIAILLCVASLAACKNDAYYTDGTEFVCYSDGELTERHVGVAEAWPKDDVWLIGYVDEAIVTYTPHRGEACGMER